MKTFAEVYQHLTACRQQNSRCIYVGSQVYNDYTTLLLETLGQKNPMWNSGLAMAADIEVRLDNNLDPEAVIYARN